VIAVVQRVSRAEVRVEGTVRGRIGTGLLVLLGVGVEDDEADARWTAAKCASLRVFADDEGKMNRALSEVGGAMLVVSQFTLLGEVVKGRRPSFTGAAPPARANQLYETFVAEVRRSGIAVETGVFQAMMEVDLVNDGPVTLLVNSTLWRGKAPGAAKAQAARPASFPEQAAGPASFSEQAAGPAGREEGAGPGAAGAGTAAGTEGGRDD